MRKVILIDDEIINTKILKTMLVNSAIFDEIYQYTEAKLALKDIEKIKPEVIFTDIEMGDMNGMELANKIYEIYPHTNIVFVTAYDKYAVDAFELSATDYILKPITLERLEKTLKKILKKPFIRQYNHMDKVKITTFCKLEISRGINYIHWEGLKSSELFAYMINNVGKSVHKDELIEALWDNFDYRRGLANMQTTMCRVRKSLYELSNEINIEYSGGYYKMVLGNVYFDRLEFENLALGIDNINETNISQALKLTELYQGDYMEKEGYIWSYGTQNLMRKIYTKILKKLVNYYCNNNEVKEAIILLEKIVSKNPENYFSKELLKKLS